MIQFRWIIVNDSLYNNNQLEYHMLSNSISEILAPVQIPNYSTFENNRSPPAAEAQEDSKASTAPIATTSPGEEQVLHKENDDSLRKAQAAKNLHTMDKALNKAVEKLVADAVEHSFPSEL